MLPVFDLICLRPEYLPRNLQSHPEVMGIIRSVDISGYCAQKLMSQPLLEGYYNQALPALILLYLPFHAW